MDWRLIEECGNGSLEALQEFLSLLKRRGVEGGFPEFIQGKISVACHTLKVPFREACVNRDIGLVRELVNEGLPLREGLLIVTVEGFEEGFELFIGLKGLTDSDLFDALWSACKTGQVEFAKTLIDLTGPAYRSLNTAAEEGHLEIVKYSLQAGAKPNDTAFKGALCQGHLDIARLLVRHGPFYVHQPSTLITLCKSPQARSFVNGLGLELTHSSSYHVLGQYLDGVRQYEKYRTP